MDRRQFLKWSSLALRAALVPGCSLLSKHQKPNIVFVLIDDLGWTDVG